MWGRARWVWCGGIQRGKTVIKIVTDTGGNIPPEIVDEFDITVVSGSIIFGNEIIVEYPNLPPAEFYRRLTTQKELPQGRDPGVRDFHDAFRKIAEQHRGATILCVHVSEALGTAMNAARQAEALMPDQDIRLFDTRSVTFGEGMMVWEAARMARAGSPVNEILARLDDMRRRVSLFVAVDTLEYLARGGRVGPMARLVGGLLDVKPVLTVQDGVVKASGQHRTRAHALDHLRALTMQECRGVRDLRIGVMHAVCEADARRLADEFQQELSPESLVITEIGAAVGSHTGPGALGGCWWYPEQAQQ